ncbi:hypothetical protein BD410DRAFT_842972 [Rickenella mellea]|uniref:C2H2-type domain-containing protein n=1 Tax=Rickenella mellea TaxID=50990 RepID=A0A4Y7PSV3_9AGAM|nr:hypothetical protein BD410DRAFT_842972 [Rickenella mellea]
MPRQPVVLPKSQRLRHQSIGFLIKQFARSVRYIPALRCQNMAKVIKPPAYEFEGSAFLLLSPQPPPSPPTRPPSPTHNNAFEAWRRNFAFTSPLYFLPFVSARDADRICAFYEVISHMAPFHCPFPDCEDSFLKEGDRYDHLISDHKGVACSRAGCEELFFDESSKKKHRALVHQPTASVTAVFGTKKYERKLIMTRDDTTKEFHCPSRGCDVAKAVPSLIQRHVKDAHTGDKKRCGIPRDLLTRVRKPGEEVPDYSSDEVVSSDEEEQGEGEEEAQRSQEQAQQNEDDEDRRSDEEGDRQDDDAMDIELGGEREERDSVAGDTQPILEKHDVFSVMGFHVLQPFQVLVCLDCQYAVRPGLALSHARTRGVHRRKRRLPDTGEFAEAISVLRDAGEPYYKPPRPVKPLPGLKIRDGLICEKCRYITGNETYMRGHFTAMHKGFDLRSNTRSCKMQRFFEKAEKKGEDRHWEVLEVDDTPVATTAVSKYIQENRREAAEKRKNGPVVVRGPETDRDLNYFLYKTRYLQVVGKADTQFLYSKAQIPKEDEPWLFPLVASVREYVVDFAFDHLENMHLSTRRWLNTQKGELNNEPFKRRQEKSSVIAAADLLCRVICIVMRSLHDEIPEFEIPLTTRQDVTSGDFFEALEKGEEHAEYIHPFVLSLFTSTPGEEEEEGNSEPLYCAVSRCILMTTLAEDGRFNRPNYISTTLTGHQYWMRLAAAYEINAQARGREHRELMYVIYQLVDGLSHVRF